jgi:hypothetical protein
MLDVRIIRVRRVVNGVEVTEEAELVMNGGGSGALGVTGAQNLSPRMSIFPGRGRQELELRLDGVTAIDVIDPNTISKEEQQ